VRVTLIGAIATSLVTIVTVSPQWAMALVFIVVSTVLGAIALPAVWSSDKDRRKDARATLGLLLQWANKLLDTLLHKRGS
jgi:hypothetical protein